MLNPFRGPDVTQSSFDSYYKRMGDQGNFRVGHLFQSAVLDARFANITATDS